MSRSRTPTLPRCFDFLIEQHDLRQTDLAKIFGSQSNVSEILNGKREINARQARALGQRFGVSPAVFI
jgi:HTH-type transcriptional regulator/antitoxin HigA